MHFSNIKKFWHSFRANLFYYFKNLSWGHFVVWTFIGCRKQTNKQTGKINIYRYMFLSSFFTVREYFNIFGLSWNTKCFRFRFLCKKFATLSDLFLYISNCIQSNIVLQQKVCSFLFYDIVSFLIHFILFEYLYSFYSISF